MDTYRLSYERQYSESRMQNQSYFSYAKAYPIFYKYMYFPYSSNIYSSLLQLYFVYP